MYNKLIVNQITCNYNTNTYNYESTWNNDLKKEGPHIFTEMTLKLQSNLTICTKRTMIQRKSQFYNQNICCWSSEDTKTD